MPYADSLRQRGFAQTTRRDAWWLQPLVVFVILTSFLVYATWAAFQNAHYTHGPYLSPFYSPEIFGSSPHAMFGPKPEWWPAAIPFSPSLLILWAPAGFRFTCYYYRGAYYKAFWSDPANCAVGEPRKSYLGERSLPLILQNVHRYFFYVAALFIALLAWDAWKAMWFELPGGGTEFGIGVGTLVLLVNVVFLGSYTFGCHSWRHIVGGRKDCLTESPTCFKAWQCTSLLNRKHMLFAWLSLFSVALSDAYVRLCSMGVFTDVRIL